MTTPRIISLTKGSQLYFSQAQTMSANARATATIYNKVLPSIVEITFFLSSDCIPSYNIGSCSIGGQTPCEQVLFLLAKIQLISISSKYSHNFPFFIHNSPIDTVRICGFPRESSQPGHAIRGSTGFPELLSFCRVKSNRLFASSPRGMNG